MHTCTFSLFLISFTKYFSWINGNTLIVTTGNAFLCCPPMGIKFEYDFNNCTNGQKNWKNRPSERSALIKYLNWLFILNVFVYSFPLTLYCTPLVLYLRKLYRIQFTFNKKKWKNGISYASYFDEYRFFYSSFFSFSLFANAFKFQLYEICLDRRMFKKAHSSTRRESAAQIKWYIKINLDS